MKIIQNSHFLLFYFTVPLIIYGISSIAAYFSGGHISVYWYIGADVSAKTLVQCLVLHTLLGLLLYKIVSNLNLKLNSIKSSRTIYISLLCGFLFFLYLESPITHLKLFFLVLFSILLPSSNFSISNFLLFFIGIIEIIFFEHRWPLIASMILLSSTKKYSFLNSLFLLAIGMLLAIFVLDPLRHSIPVGSNIDSGIYATIIRHFNPILLAAEFFSSNSVPTKDLIAEAIPLGKSLLNSKGLASMAKEAVTGLVEGDFGTNSTSILNKYGIFITTIFLLIQPIFLKLVFYRRSIVIYLLLLGPVFFRRSFLNFINDLITIFFFCLLIYIISNLLKICKNSNERKNTYIH